MAALLSGVNNIFAEVSGFFDQNLMLRFKELDFFPSNNRHLNFSIDCGTSVCEHSVSQYIKI